jgi:cytochrome d ubiquinol oxidase subunit II
MLMPAASEQEQSTMVAAIGPFWDANETWLVLGIGVLLVAFPQAHGMILGALYLPVLAMLVGLMLRGVAFELRIKALGWHRELWNGLFWLGSFVAAFAQGFMLGRYVTGFHPGFASLAFAFLVGASLCGGYVLLGAAWLVLKCEGELQTRARAWTRWGLLWTALGIALVSVATPLASRVVRERWFDFPQTLALMLLPAATAAAWFWIWRASRSAAGRGDWKPFAGAIAIFTLAFAGLAYSLFPWIVLERLTIWQAAAHPSALTFFGWGCLVVLPFVVANAVLVYRIFRGKTREALYEF